MTLFPLIVEIQLKFDSKGGPVVKTSQGTQACGDELVVTKMSEGMPEGTQDTQAGSHEMVVTGVRCKEVEPGAPAGLPLKEAGVIPTAHEVLNFIALKYFQTVDTTKPEERSEFLSYLTAVRSLLFQSTQTGSLIVTVLCTSLEILDALWYDYCTGHLSDVAQKYLVTKDVLREFDLTELKLTTTLQLEECMAARKFFLEGSGEHIHSVTESCL